jgi:hypothetical protein
MQGVSKELYKLVQTEEHFVLKSLLVGLYRTGSLYGCFI